ncbi:MAG: fimbrillin family protein, partial [Alistipes sp.]
TVAMASCAKNAEVFTNTPVEIGLSAYNHNAAPRVAAFDGTTFPTTLPIFVSALYHNEAGGNETYFENVKFTYNTDSWKAGWYYPFNGTIDFLAYSTEKEVAADWTIGSEIESVKLTFTDPLDGKEDVLYSDRLAGITCPQTVSKNLTFHHALAWLYFNIKAKTTAAADAVKINSITVNNVSLSGDALITAGATSSVAWSNPSTPTNVAVPDFTTTPLTTTAQSVANGLLVVPQSQTSFTINYTITNGTGSGVVEKTMNYTVDLTADSPTWDDAKKYIYNINVSLNEITFTADVVDYTEPVNPDVDLE